MIVSGGHTHIVNVKSYSEFEILVKTMDDAIGEAFDKVARTVGLGYPGGPKVDKCAKNGQDVCNFPRPIFENLNFSFSGIKSAVINVVYYLAIGTESNVDAVASYTLEDEAGNAIGSDLMSIEFTHTKLENKDGTSYPNTPSSTCTGLVDGDYVLLTITITNNRGFQEASLGSGNYQIVYVD